MASTQFVCPQCQARSAIAKELPEGALVRCPKCKVVIRLEGSNPEPTPPPAPVSAKRIAPSPSANPKPSATSAPKSAARKPVASRAHNDDEIADEMERPRKRPGKKSGSNSTVMIGAVLGGVLLIGLVVVIVGVVAFGGSKKQNNAQAATTPPLGPLNRPDTMSGPAGPRPDFGGGPVVNPNRPGSDDSTKQPSNNQTSKSDDSSTESGFVPTSPANSGSVQDIYEYVLKSTALILNVTPQGIASGTGSVIDVNERLILTNYHVIANTREMVVFFPIYENGKPIAERDRYLSILKERTKSPDDLLLLGEMIASDPQRDLALIRVPKLPAGVEALPMAKGLVNIGQTVHSIGNPGVSDALWVYTQGAVRSVYRKKWKAGGEGLLLTLDAEVIETQSPTNPGDSGGPLVNDRGELVGVTQGLSSEGRQISYFISLNEARDFVEREYQRKFAKAWSPTARTALRLRGGGGDVTTLISALDHKDAKTRALAAKSLGEMGADAKLAIRRLMRALKDPDELTARVAAESLSKIGAPGRDDLPALTDALKDPKPEVRRYASAALGQMGSEASSAARQLADVLADPDERVRESAVRSLGSLGSSAKSAAVPRLSEALNDESKEVRVAAAASLTNLLSPPSADDVPLFVTILKHPDAEASVFGARALTKLGNIARAAVPDLLKAAREADPVLRRGAIDSLAAIGPEASSAVPVYVAALKDGDSLLRQSALLALGHVGKDLEKEKDAITAVLDAVGDSDAHVKRAALTAIAKLGPVIGAAGAKQITPTLIEDVQNKEIAIRDQALDTVAGLGALGKDVVPTLITMMEKRDIKLYKDSRSNKIFLQDADEAFLDRIAKTIGKVGQPAIRALVASLNTSNINFGQVMGICRSLGEIGPPARSNSTVATLQSISQSNLPPPVCFEADRALRRITAK